MAEIEPFHRVLAADDLVVAMAPAEPEQIVEQGLGQDAELVAIGVDAERAMALGELRPVRPVDQRHVGVDRLGPAHRPDDRQLAEGVVEMVVAADHVGDAHVVIVDDDRQHVGRRAVRAEQHEIVDLAVLDRDPPLDLVLDRPSRRRAAPSGAPRRARPASAGRGRSRARRCRSGTAAARLSPPRAAPPAPPGSSSIYRHGRQRAARAPPSRGGRRIRTGTRPRRPSRARASACRRGSPSIASRVERALSVSSILSRNLPP